MSRNEDIRLYRDKKCVYQETLIDINMLYDKDFITSELTATTTKEELENVKHSLIETARIVDGIAEELSNDNEYHTIFQDSVFETIEQVIKSRLIGDKNGCVKWFNPCTDVIEVAELQYTPLPPMKWLIDDFLPLGGVVMISAKPKMGKSFLALQLAVAVAGGGDFLGFKAQKNEVLYIDLETSQRSMKNRFSMLTDNAPNGLWLMNPENVYQFGNIGNGFEAQVNYYLEQHEGVKLIVVDTYGLIQGSRMANQNIYRQEYAEISNLNTWARKKGFTLVLIHHQNKQDDYENPVQGISGSTGITGGLQAYYILSKRQYTDEITKLTIGGKEIKERDIFIQPESDSNRTWVEVEPEDRPSRQGIVSTSKITMAIRELVGVNDDIEVTAKELAEAVDMTPKDVGQWLNNYVGELEEYQQITFTKARRNCGTVYQFKIDS